MKKKLKILLILLLGHSINLAQDPVIRPPESVFESPQNNLWVGSYNAFRLTDKLFWRAEFHYRRGNHDGIPFIGKMSQIYNRHAIQYVHSSNFNMSLGGVLRLDFTPDPDNVDLKHVIHEPRIWHEYLFMMPLSRFRVYHRIRIEHRWTTNYNPDVSNWSFRNRWRYKFFMKIPLNKKTLGPGTIYFNPDVEIIMHSGKTVIDNPLEDLRIYPSLCYIYNSRVTYSAGLMYTTGQRGNNGSVYRQRYVIRVNAYFSLDFRKETKKIPKVNILD
jgi:hypothetical protein